MDGRATVEEEQQGGRKSCCQSVKHTVRLVPQNITRPSWGFLSLVLFSLFSSGFTLTFLSPFLPEMILTFGYKEEEKGIYVGLMASSVFAGRVVGSFFWGWLSDVKGRRLVLLITIFFNGLFSFLFGFVGSLHLAMLLRMLSGLANCGTVIVAKTVLYDISDNTNQAFHMSTISIAWGSGLVLGPTLGGYLALPAAKYPDVFSPDGFFADFPFVLPSLCCLLFSGVAFVIDFIQFKDPKLVLNKEVAADVPAENDVSTDPAVRKATTRNNGNGVLSSQPLLETLPCQSYTSVQRPHRAGMSLETLHCESEVLYCYAQIQSAKNERINLLEEETVSRSMHNLSPRPKSSCSDDAFLSVIRKRSYSHGDQFFPQKLTEPLNRDSARLPHQDTEIVVESEDKSAVLGTSQREQNSRILGNDSSLTEFGDVEEVNEQYRGKGLGAGKKSFTLSSCWQSIRHSALIHILSLRDVRHSAALYTVMSFAVIGFEDVFTVFASTAIEYDGLGFSTDEIGTALGAVSIPLMFIQIKIYPMLVARFGIKRTYLISIFFILVPIQLLPMLHLLVHQKAWLWVCLLVLILSKRVADSSCFTGTALLINNSVTADMAGKANGIGMTVTAIVRTLAPAVGGAMFSWTVKMNQTVGSPLDINLTFVFFGFILFINALQCLYMPDHLDRQKK